MHRVTPLLLVLATGAFVGSSARFAWLHHSSAIPADEGGIGLFSGMRRSMRAVANIGNDPTALTDPSTSALRLLLVVVWVAVLAHALRTLHRSIRDREAGGRHAALHMRDHRLVEHGPLILSLVAAAAYPWVAEMQPVAGFLLAVAMATAALGAVLRGDRDGSAMRYRLTVGLYAGWAVAAMFASFAAFATQQLGISGSVSSLVAIVLLAATAIATQLRLGAVIGFAVAVVWALIGVAAESMQQDATVATAAVIAIAAMTTVLVRVTT